jgi:hypothetical protein
VSQNPLVQILLGTYNGARFLREQIDSILAQTYQPLKILARDDGSKDETRAILEQYAANFSNRFELLPVSAPSGNAKFNFMHLLAAAEAPYIAFADQDDVWVPSKVERTMQAMRTLEHAHGTQHPLLVFTDLRVVDDRLQTLNESFWSSQQIRPEHIHSLRSLIMQNVVTGCTMLINRPLQQASLPMPKEAFMHDWWIALIANTEGDATFLREPTVLYRQHGGNVLGAPTPPPVTGIPKWRQHQQRRKYFELTAVQAAALRRSTGDRMPRAKRQLLDHYLRCETSASRLVRVFTLVRHRFFVNGLRANLALLWYLWDMDRAKRDFPINPV